MKASEFLKKKGNLIQNKYGQWIFISKKVEFETNINEDETTLKELDESFVDINDHRDFKNIGYVSINKLKDRLNSLYKLVSKYEMEK